jgi:hypothetical protein
MKNKIEIMFHTTFYEWSLPFRILFVSENTFEIGFLCWGISIIRINKLKT